MFRIWGDIVNTKKIVIITAFLCVAAAAYFVRQQYAHQHEATIEIVDIVVEAQLPEQAEQPEEQTIAQPEIAEPVAAEPKPMIEVASAEDLQDILSNKKELAILFFHMNGCGWCKKMDPVYQEVAKNPDFASIQFYSVNGKDCNAQVIVKEITDQQMNGYPTLIFMNEDGYLDKQVGFAQQQDFEQKIKKLFFNEQDEQAAPIIVKKETKESDNVVIQTATINTINGVCSGNYNGSTPPIGAYPAVKGDYVTGNCNSNMVCVSSSNYPYIAPKNESGTCQSCALIEWSSNVKDVGYGQPTNSGYSPSVPSSFYSDNPGYYAYEDSNNLQYPICFISSYSGAPCSGVQGSNQGTCSSSFVCLTTNTGTETSGSMLKLASSAANGQCYPTTGLTKNTTTGIVTAGTASGDIGQTGECSAQGKTCVGGYQGAVGTCCSGSTTVATTYCMAGDSIAAYSEIGVCTEQLSCNGTCALTDVNEPWNATTNPCKTGSIEANCSAGFNCLAYDPSNDTVQPAGSGVHGECYPSGKGTDDTYESTTIGNTCSKLNKQCVGTSTGTLGTCCAGTNVNCMIEPTDGKAYTYAESDQVGSCAQCSSVGCTGNAYNTQGTCCPGMYCLGSEVNGASTAAAANGSGSCTYDEPSCSSQGSSCTGTTQIQGTCCINLMCATTSSYESYESDDNTELAAVTNGSTGVCGPIPS